MTSISALIDFLMSLMRDEDTKRAFADNPEGTMADKGLQDVSAQDVQDARLIMADDGAVKPRQDGGGQQANGYHEGGLTAGGNSAVREIVHTTNTFEIDQSKHIDQTILTIDNSDTTIIDSFNSQDTVTAIQDNDTVNNDVDVVNVEDSFNDEDDDENEDETEDPADGKDETGDEAGAPEGVKAPEPREELPPDAQPAAGPAPDPGEGEVRIQPVEAGPEDVPFDPEPAPEPEPEPFMVDEPVMVEADDDLPVA